MKPTFSNWRSVRMWESRVVRDLRQQRWLWLHGLWIGLLTLAVTWGISALQMRWGVESLAVRYLVSLGAGYLVYLLTIRLWAAALLQRPSEGWHDGSGLDLLGEEGGHLLGGECGHLPSMTSGGGGDFSVDAVSVPDGVVDGVADLAGNAIAAAAESDDAAIVVVPVVAIFVLGCAIFFGAGALFLLYFGWEVLLAVAVELAFSYASARAAVRVTREGWASVAVRLTWKPLAGAVVCAVTLGATIDHFIPAAQTLPQALSIVRAQLSTAPGGP